MDQNLCQYCNHVNHENLLICTVVYCDQNSRYLCKFCQKNQNHNHNQKNDLHIMGLSDLCKHILNLISRHQTQNQLWEKWKIQFKKGTRVFEDHSKTSFFDNCFEDGQYEYICKLKKDMLYQILQDISKNLNDIDFEQICVLCFNQEFHNHQEMINTLKQQEYIISHYLQIDFYYSFDYAINVWKNQSPFYNKQQFDSIKSLLINNQQIDDGTINRLILLKNGTYNLNGISKIIKGEIDYQLKLFDKQNVKIQKQSNIEYFDDNPAPITLEYDLPYEKFQFPQFLVSPNESDFILQDFKYNLMIGVINTGQIKLAYKLKTRIAILQFSKDMKYLFCSCNDGYILGFLTKNYQLYFKRKLHNKSIRTLLPKNNNEIITYGDDYHLKFTNYKTNKIIIQIKFKGEDLVVYFEQMYENNQIKHSMQYDDKQQIIYVSFQGISIKSRRILRLKERSFNKCLLTFQLQLINNNSCLLSADNEGLKQWKLIKFNLILIKQYDVNIVTFRQVRDERIILMGMCFIELLNQDFQRVKLKSIQCNLKSLDNKVLQRKFQIESQNSCYFISIFDGIIFFIYMQIQLSSKEEQLIYFEYYYKSIQKNAEQYQQQIMDQETSNCLVHNRHGSSLICTIENCARPSRYLCEYCLKDKTHEHDQENENHLINLTTLCGDILHMIKQYQKDYEFYSELYSETFRKLAQIQNRGLGRTHNFDDPLNEKFEYLCIIKQKMLRNLFNGIQEHLRQQSKQFICVECFNSVKLNHNEHVDNLNLKLFVELYDYDQKLPKYSDIEKIHKPWINQKPNYNQDYINQIEEYLNNSKISNVELEKLILLKNKTLDVSRVYQLLQKVIDKSLNQLNKEFDNGMKLKYFQMECYTEKYICDLDQRYPFFHIVPNEEQYLSQNQKMVLEIHDLVSNRIIQKAKLRNRIVVHKFTQNMRYLFLGDDCGYLICFKCKCYKQIFKQQIHISQIEAIHPISDQLVITCSNDRFLKITNISLNKKMVKVFFSNKNFSRHKECAIEYNKNNDTIFIAKDCIFILKRHLAKIVIETDQVYRMQHMQLIDDNLILSANQQSLLLWNYDGKQKLSLLKQYQVQLRRFRYIPENNIIIIVGKCFIELLDIKLKRIKFGISNCREGRYEEQLSPIKMQFQIENKNSQYCLTIFDKACIKLIQGNVQVQRKKIHLDFERHINQ